MSGTSTVIPCAIIRGGTSKGVFVLEEHLSKDLEQRDRTLIALMGSPDPRQIDGLGGADPLTSKAVIVTRSTRAGIDVEYETVEVGLGEAFVNHGIMCGNLTAGVAYFAMLEGLLQPQAPLSTVRMFCRNTGKVIVGKVPLTESAGSNKRASPAEIRGAAANVSLIFEDPAGAVTGKLLPTGEPTCTVKIADGRSVRVSVVDAGTLYAFVRAEDFGVTGAEEATVLDANLEFRAAIEASRVQVTQLINERLKLAEPLSHRRLKVAIVSKPGSQQSGVDVLARVINIAKVHKAYAVSGGISLGSAAAIPGTLVHELLEVTQSPCNVRIGHPSGVLSILIHCSASDAGQHIQGAEIQRSVRIIMRGEAYLPAESLS